MEATDHFADAVLECGDDGAQSPQLQDHAGQLITGDATDGLQILRLVANVVSADGRAGAVDHVVVEGQKDIGGCQERKECHEKSNGRSPHSCSHRPANGVPSWKDLKPGAKDMGRGRGIHICGSPFEVTFIHLLTKFPGVIYARPPFPKFLSLFWVEPPECPQMSPRI